MFKGGKIDSRSYYNMLPSPGHSCGDIWQNLPSFGMLGDTPCAGVVITPACDLSWYKSDTLTYLPIIPVRQFFSTDAALPIVLERMKFNIRSTGCDIDFDWSPKIYIAPQDEDLDIIQEKLEKYRLSRKNSAKTLLSIDQALSSISIIRSVKKPNIESVSGEMLRCCFGNEWGKIKDRIIRNNHSPATHFLPQDGQNRCFSGVPEHSMVLFRYPITVPVKVLNYAEESSELSWPKHIENLNITSIMKKAFSSARPVKMISLKSAFLSDLLTRFSALYNRIGSPDFSKETVESYSLEVDL